MCGFDLLRAIRTEPAARGIGCPIYAGQCSTITLFDQSTQMLDECRKKVAARNVVDRCVIIRRDFTTLPRP